MRYVPLLRIDRIMEKFAERYVRENPGKFSNADGAYVLAFAIIMLNTDAHNPLAERRLGKADFVAMNSQPVAPAPHPPQQQQQQQQQQEPGDGGGSAVADQPPSDPPPPPVLSYELVLPAEV